MSGYACAGATWKEASLLPISRHPAKVVPRRVLPVTPDMAGEVEVIHRSEGRVKKDTLLLRINPEELALDEQELRGRWSVTTSPLNSARRQGRQRLIFQLWDTHGIILDI